MRTLSFLVGAGGGGGGGGSGVISDRDLAVVREEGDEGRLSWK